MEENNKISVSDYLDNPDLLLGSYIPFDDKLKIVSHIMQGLIDTTGGINTALLRRMSTTVFIESLTNIDMNVRDVNGLDGYDQLCFKGELENLIDVLGTEYKEFDRILSEYMNDYIRVETNPSVTINAIYKQIIEFIDKLVDYLSGQIQNADVEQLTQMIAQLAKSNEVMNIESK